MSAVDELRALLYALPASEYVHPIYCEIAGFPNFFPGGAGFVGPEFPHGGVMFIGHNFDTYDGYLRSVARGFESPAMPTWRNLRSHILPEAQLAEHDCFFSNVYLGAILHPPVTGQQKKKNSNTGNFRASTGYKSACVLALAAQVKIVRPRVVALLGGNVPRPFGEAFPEFRPFSSGPLEQRQREQPHGGRQFELVPGTQTRVVMLVHPSNPRSIESHRQQGRLLRAALNLKG